MEIRYLKKAPHLGQHFLAIQKDALFQHSSYISSTHINGRLELRKDTEKACELRRT